MKIFSKIAHYLLPGHTNNHKARILHTSSLFLITLFLIFYQVGLQMILSKRPSVLGYASNIPPDTIINLINQKRAENGLPELSYNAALTSAAQAKGADMLARNYWAHVAPDGTEPWSFIISAGYRYKYAGENLARDFSDPNSAVEAWMASPSHRDNILSTKYRETGVAVVEGDLSGVDSTIIVQFFGTQLADAGEVKIAQAQVEVTSTPTPSPVPTIAEVIEATSPALVVSPEPKQPIMEEETASAPAAAVSNTEEQSGIKSLFSPFDVTRAMSLVTIIVLGIVMVVDAIIVSKKRITRLSGKNMAHLAFLGVILSIILIAGSGRIL